jgi:PAS domain S-box-containing protein
MRDQPAQSNGSESVAELKARLAEAEETLRAIREGEVDAVVVSGPHGDRVYTLTGADSVYRRIVDTMNEAAFTVSCQGAILYCNARFGEIVKRPLEHIVGHELDEFVTQEEMPAVKRLLTEGCREPVKRRLVFTASDGRRVPALIASNVLEAAGGWGICVVATDLTDLENSTELIAILRKQQAELAESQERLRGVNEALARHVSEIAIANEEVRAAQDHALTLMEDAQAARRKTDELNTQLLREIAERKRVEEELALTVKELARSNGDLEQFAYAASHDLKEPLRAVSGCVQLLQRRFAGKLDERGDEYIAHAVDGAARMENLIDSLLAYSRVGTRGARFEAIEGAAVLDAALKNLTAAIQESGAVIRLDTLPTVLGDATQLVLVFQNLISNALKFCNQPPPRIHVSAERDGAQWRFSIRDNGIGIDPQSFERIFGVFQRLHTRAEYPGTGIGLAICKKIVERHGGRIWLESAPGKGSTFYFTVPEAQQQPAQRDTEVRSGSRNV